MNIPTSEEFLSFSKDIGSFNVGFLLDKLSRIPIEADAIRSLLEPKHKVAENIYSTIRDHVCDRWLGHQPSYNRAWKAIGTTKSLRRISLDEVIHILLDTQKERTKKSELQLWGAAYFVKEILNKKTLSEHLEHVNSEEIKRRRFTSRFRRFLRQNPYEWLIPLAESLDIYFYSRMWDVGNYSPATFQRQCKNAIKAIETLQTLKEFEKYTEFVLIRPHQESFLQQRIEVFKHLVKPESLEVLPIKRLDTTTKERWLVFQLFNGFYRLYRTPKANAIYHILSFQGIENNLEQRTVERLIQGWRRSKKEFTRQLPADNRHLRGMNVFH